MRRKDAKQTQPDGEYRLVYSTEPIAEKKCANCENLISSCRCDLEKIKSGGPLKGKVRFEKKGRGGKSVTVVSNLPAHETVLKELCKFLKRSLSSGGTYYVEKSEGVVEIQGNWSLEVPALMNKFVL